MTSHTIRKIVRKFDMKNQTDNQKTNESIEELLRNLDMEPIQYEQNRKEISKKHNIRLKLLDSIYHCERKSDDTNNSLNVVENIEPWQKTVHGSRLIHEIIRLISRHVVLEEGLAVVVAFWVLLTYCYEQFRHLPILGIVSPQKRCGKTTLLEVLTGLVNKNLIASNISSAAVYRTIDKFGPTLLIDEADSFFMGNDEMRNVLNSGHTKSGAFVIRCDGNNNEPKRFNTFCPKVVALIGKLPSTLADRSIIVNLKRKTQKEQLEKIPMGFKNETADIRKKCQRWANDHKHQLKFKQSAIITIPGNDRAEDNWKPLATIAGVIGKNWFIRLQKISKDMMDFAEESDEISILLLEDVKEIFEDMDMDKIFTNSLLRRLSSLP